MRLEYKLVIGVAIFGGLVSSIVIYVGGLLSPPPVVVEEPTITLPPPKVSTVLPPTSTPIPTPTEEPILRARLSHYWPAWGPPCATSHGSAGSRAATAGVVRRH